MEGEATQRTSMATKCYAKDVTVINILLKIALTLGRYRREGAKEDHNQHKVSWA